MDARTSVRLCRLSPWLLAGILFAPALFAEDTVDFARDVQPLLNKRCLPCHGGVRRSGGLNLSSLGGRTPVGDSGEPLFVSGKPDESELIRRLVTTDADIRMPAESPPLPAQEVSILRRWIAQGAVWPRHWAFNPLSAASPPQLAENTRANSPLDCFVLKGLSASRIAPASEADRFRLIRRLSLDLIGLPPTPDEADAFASDESPNAYERLVDRLLASPHFGERWGRHWLDQARYADSDGYEVDKPRPDAYRWRDWVIAAVNQDMPLDQFTIEQFAGDLVPAATELTHLATAYHRQTLTNNEGGVDKEEYRLKAVLDRVSNLGTVWLGLTLGCAQCHDHPYDPFTQREYFALAAIFNSADETEIELGDAVAVGGKKLKYRVLSERDTPRATRLWVRGEFLQPGEEVQPGVLGGLHPLIEEPESPAESPLNRLDLARWLMDPANPLTPRVLANQTWLHLFGKGLVRTPDDFGTRGEQPTHPKLLDWLARELLAGRYERKALIRKIVCSATYRQASLQRPEQAMTDPENRLLARQNRVRVEAEIIRDLQLSAGGLLSPKIGGPSVFPPLGPEFEKITFRSTLPWTTSSGEDRYRRGMYTFFKRSVPYPDLMIFDCPDSTSAAVARPVSNTPLQALAALNSETSLDAARGLAARVLALPLRDDERQLTWMYRSCLTRPPTIDELQGLLALHGAHRRWYKEHSDDAAKMAAPVVTDDEMPAESAALVTTANILMNLDAFFTRE
jgi:hypothetical protein